MEEKIINWIKEEVNKAGAKGVIIGLSGGIDSSCVAVLCKKAFPENILGIIMPCISNPKDMEDANLVAEKFNIPTKIVDLEESFKSIFNSLENKEYRKESDGGVSIANIKPRDPVLLGICSQVDLDKLVQDLELAKARREEDE